MRSSHTVAMGLLFALAGAAPAAASDAVANAAVPAALLESAEAALVARLARAGTSEAPVLVVAEAVTWADTGLGCAAPGAARAQVLVPGYRLVYTVAGRRYEVHAAAAGAVVVCARPLPRPLRPPPGTVTTPQ